MKFETRLKPELGDVRVESGGEGEGAHWSGRGGPEV